LSFQPRRVSATEVSTMFCLLIIVVCDELEAYPQSGRFLRLQRWRRRGPRGSSPSGAPLRGRGLRRLLWRISRWTPGVIRLEFLFFVQWGRGSVVGVTHFERFQVELEERLVDGSEVLLDARFAEAVCDTADEGPVFGEGLGKFISDEIFEKNGLVDHLHPRKRRTLRPPRLPR